MSLHQTTITEEPQIGSIVLETFYPFMSQDVHKKLSYLQKNKNKQSSQIQAPHREGFNIVKTVNAKQSTHQDLFNAPPAIQKLMGIQFNKIVKHIMKSNYEKLLNQYEGTNLKFTDSSFPATGKSIGGRWTNHNNWKRISDIMPNAVFVNQKIQPNDILQGEIGDCYFLSALAALAEKDYRLKNIFGGLQIQKNGIYMARILHRGILQQVVVDDYIPVNQKNQPIFAKASGGNQIWVIILEKCWAKLHKSYSVISGGLPHQVLHAFSGAPTLYNSIPRTKQQQDQLFQLIYEADKKGAVLCCGTKFDPQMQKKGLVIGHAYTLLQVYKQPYKMIKIRNPWGQKQWIGRASEKDTQFWSKISEQGKKQLGYQQKNDGVFFMIWQDFISVFNMVDICLINDNASYLSVSSEFRTGKGKMFELQIDQNEKVVLSISQQNIRNFKTQLQKKQGYAKTVIIFAKYNPQRKKGYEFSFYKASQYHILPDHYMTFDNLEPGSYIVFVSCDWFQQTNKQATVAVYSQSKLNLKQNNQIDPQLFLYEVFMDHARRNSKKRQTLKEQPLQWMCYQFLLDKCGYGYAAYHMHQQSQHRLGIQIDEKQYTNKNLKLLKPYAGNGKMKTIVKPGQQLIILFKIDPYRSSPSFTIPLPRVCKLLKQ